MSNGHNLLGQKFGRLTVTGRSDVKNFRNKMWTCLCDCGQVTIVSSTRLISLHTRSCGCLRNELASKRIFKLRPYESLYKLLLADNDQRKIKYPVNLTYEEFVTFTKTQECHYCGDTIIWYKHRNNTDLTSGYNLDRKDSTKGYSVDNCVVCCAICNWMKWRLGYDQFIRQIKKISKRFDE